MNFLFSLFVIISILVCNIGVAIADTAQNFDKFMSEWNEKKELASEYLLKAEKEFQAGDELSACASQKEASEYGIEATQSLIYAMEANGTKESIENLRAGLNKWKEIGDVCGSIFN